MRGSYICGRHCTGGKLRNIAVSMLEVVQAYVIKWQMKFNSRNSKIMVVLKKKGGTSWKICEEIMEEVEEFN